MPIDNRLLAVPLTSDWDSGTSNSFPLLPHTRKPFVDAVAYDASFAFG